MTSQFISENLQLWREKAANGTITIDEMKEAIEAIRKERAATEAAPKPKTRKVGVTTVTKRQKPEDVNSDDLLGELGL